MMFHAIPIHAGAGGGVEAGDLHGTFGAIDAEHAPAVVGAGRPRVTGSDWLIALALVAIALAVRRVGLAPASLWLDDAWVAAGASRATWDQALSVGVVSPGFTLLLRPFIAIGGDAPLAAQFLPLAAGVFAPGLLYLAMVDRRVRRAAALVPAILLVSAPFHVSYSVFVKQYTSEALLSIALVWSAWTILDDGHSRRRWARLLLVACASFAISAPVWPVVAVAVGVAGVSALRRSDDRRWILWTAAGAAAFGLAWAALVVAPRVNDQLHDYWAGKYIDTEGGIGATVASAGERLWAAFGGLSSADRRAGLFGIALAAIVVVARRPVVGLLLLGPLAIAIGLAAAELAPIGTGRTDLYLYPPVLIVVGLALDWVAEVTPRRVGAALLLVAILAASTGTIGVERQAYPQEDVRTLVRTLDSERAAGDLTLVYPLASFAFALYSDAAVELVPSSEYATGWAVSAEDADVRVLPNRTGRPTEYEPFVLDAIEGRDRVWFLASHQKSADVDEIRRVLRSEGFSQQSADVRPGALLDLWVRGDGAPD